jgi:hypothetical protein
VRECVCVSLLFPFHLAHSLVLVPRAGTFGFLASSFRACVSSFYFLSAAVCFLFSCWKAKVIPPPSRLCVFPVGIRGNNSDDYAMIC